MKLHDYLQRPCVIIPLSNGITVCGARGPRVRCARYFQHMVLYTIVKYMVFNMDGRGYIVRFEHSTGFRQQKFMLICKRFIHGNVALKYAAVCKLVCRFNNGRKSIEKYP
jgi:hypothetical protein